MAENLTLEKVERDMCTAIQTLLALNEGAVTPETPLRRLGIDSLRFVTLMLTIEQKFGVSLMKGGMKPADMQTARALAALVVERSKG